MKLKYVTLCVAVAFCALSLTAHAANDSVPEVTLVNFVSLQYSRTGGYAGVSSAMSVHSGMLWVSPNARFSQTANKQESYPLSFSQQLDLFDNINAAGIIQLAGNYRQNNLADGFDETLTLTVSDDQNRDQHFVIKNYGDTAPRNFYQFIDYLNELRADKTQQTTAPAQIINKDNLQSLTLNTFGGIAGKRTQIEIKAPITNGYQQWTIASQEETRGRTIRHQNNISVNELSPLLQSISQANLEEMNGKKFRQQGLFDGFNNILTITLRNGSHYTIENYGNTAPAEFYTILTEVNQLQQKQLTR